VEPRLKLPVRSSTYGFSAAAGDAPFVPSRGYVIDGVAWSI